MKSDTWEKIRQNRKGTASMSEAVPIQSKVSVRV